VVAGRSAMELESALLRLKWAEVRHILGFRPEAEGG
jgi:hypothetical protein